MTGKYKPPTQEELDKAEELAGLGMDEQNIALCLNLHPHTLSHKKAEFSLLSQAIKRGQAKGIADVTAALKANINLGNVTAQIFYLKAKAKWYDDSALRDIDDRLKNMEANQKDAKPQGE